MTFLTNFLLCGLNKIRSIVPILSNKVTAKPKDQLKEPFITFRQEKLHRFIQRVVNHPELVDAPSLRPFLTANPTDWVAAKANAVIDKDLLLKENSTNDDGDELENGMDTLQIDVHAALDSTTQDGTRKGPMRRWIAARRTKMALQNDNLQLEETPAEAKLFHDMKTYADQLEVCVKILSEDYKEILSSNRVLAEKTETMGAAFTQMWGEHLLSNTSSSSMYQSLGRVWGSASNRMKNNVAFGELYVDNPIDDLVLDIAALKDALVKRKEAVYAYTKLSQEGLTMTKQLERMKGRGDLTAQQDKYFKLETDLRFMDKRITESRSHSDLVTRRLERDAERFRVEWHERMRQVMEALHKEHVAFMQGQVNDFSQLLPALASLDSERSGVTKEAPKVEKFQISMSYDSGGARAVVGSMDTPPLPDVPPPPLPPAPSVAPPPPPLVEDDVPAGTPILSLDAVYSSDDDGFEAGATMGGKVDVDGVVPIVKSV